MPPSGGEAFARKSGRCPHLCRRRGEALPPIRAHHTLGMYRRSGHPLELRRTPQSRAGHLLELGMQKIKRWCEVTDTNQEAKKKLKQEKSLERLRTAKTIIAQSVLFLLAGYDTVSSTLSFITFLLAKNPIHQQRVRREVQELVQLHGELTYQVILDSKFLEACIMEALRLYPPAPNIERRCTKTYRLPGTDLTVRVGDMVVIPIWSLHHDARYWPDPELFLPDRFLPENKSSITTATYLPFGLGPRICIANRFAMMETKITLAKLLLAAELSLPEGQEHMELATSLILMRPRHSVNIILTTLTHSPDSPLTTLTH
ncbi:Cytochrome P450 9e2-like [Homarus americanus]|uniref:Cytochrome P450 9e2-like n=1 Tax=Homarus americanus TaxID=6706 RepID=A0A8J5NA86_HOMAM|nr:Cytochrome P450 9e2-like [Homarus americanus]